MVRMNILVVGSGGREHTISWKLAQSPLVSTVVCVPGNGGTADEPKCKNVVPGSSLDSYVKIAQDEHCELAVIGPEDPLAEGLADVFWNAGIPCVGPKKAGAQLEASKDLAKHFMQKYDVACAQSKTFTDKQAADDYIDQHGAPIVIKADGLAAGKGVVVAATIAQAHEAITDIMQSGRVGDAGKKVVIEDYLEGDEISVLAAVSVTPEYAKQNKATIVPFLPARDHKRLMDGAKGPNTGGMGAISPLSDVTPAIMDEFNKTILQPTLTGLIAEGFDYRGFIFFGVMLTKQGPKLLEYNVRLGDPETQAVLPLMDFDMVTLCSAIIDGTLCDFTCTWKKGYQVAPVAVSGGYPGAYKKGIPISVSAECFGKDTHLFIAGAVKKDNQLVTSGGRVLSCSAYGDTFDDAWNNAYTALKGVSFDGMFYRKDIGLPGAATSPSL